MYMEICIRVGHVIESDKARGVLEKICRPLDPGCCYAKITADCVNSVT